MSPKRLAGLGASLLGVALTIGVVQAGAAGGTTILRFDDTAGVSTSIGYDQNSNLPPPVGSKQIITLVIKNHVPQFGKPSGTPVGHVLIECTVLSVNGYHVDGNCSGIAHVPNGYFLFGGNGIFQDSAKRNHWAITGGVGPYAKDRGQIVVTNHADGSSSSVVTLFS